MKMLSEANEADCWAATGAEPKTALSTKPVIAAGMKILMAIL
jgi:hypothetical protein